MIIVLFIKLTSELLPSFKNTTSKRSPIPFSWKKRIWDYHRDEEIYDGLASGEDLLCGTHQLCIAVLVII